MGLLIMFEGLALVILARRIELVDVLVMDQMMTMALGAVLLVLGLLLFVPLFPQLRRISERLMKRLQVMAAMVVLVISLVFLVTASPATIEGFGDLGKMWVVLAAGQLFLMGVLAFVYLYYEPLANRRLAWLEWLGMFSACLVMTEGVVIFGMRGDLNVHGELKAEPTFMIVIGVVLAILGMLEVVVFNRRREGQSERVLEVLDWVVMGVSVTIGALGLFALYITTSMTLDGINYGYQWLLTAGMILALLAPLLNYTQTVVAGREGWNMDIGLVVTIILLVAIPFAVTL